MRMYAIFYIFLLLAFLNGTSLAQKALSPDTLQNKALADSIAKPLTTYTIAQWNLSPNDSVLALDSLLQPTFRFKDLLHLNYTGLADVFRLQPAVQSYDFLEMGLPRYVAPLHLWPQQNRIYLNGLLLNDPLSGMFNTRLVFPDALHSVFLNASSFNAPTGGPLQHAEGISLFTRWLNPKKPYTRIMYREGDFGYTDLDITFVRRLGKTALLQLGGINRDYDPNHYRGTHYRAGFTFAPAKRFLASVNYHKSSENVTFPGRLGLQEPFRRNEIWECYSAELRHLTSDFESDWGIRFLFDDVRRQMRLLESGARSRLRYDRYLFVAHKTGQYGKMRYQISAQGQQTKGWGTVYQRKYTDSRLVGEGGIEFELPDSLFLNFTSALRYRWEQPLQIEPNFSMLWLKEKWSVQLKLSRFARFPTMHERFFNDGRIAGKRTLSAESHENMDLALSFSPYDWNQNTLGLTLHNIRNEIGFNGSAFYRAGGRRFAFARLQSALRYYKFELRSGGQLGLAGELLGPRYSGYAQLRYHDRWIHGHLIVDATGTAQYFGPFKNVVFQPFAERFYRWPGESDGFLLLTFKLLATVKDAHLFMEMDNPLNLHYHFIYGYTEIYRRVRFGVSWVLWN